LEGGNVIYVILIVCSYLLGSVPFGLLIAKAHGKDLRSVGSGNIGATNVARALGRKWAYVCFLLDMLKGLVPMLATMFLTTSAHTQAETGNIIHLWLWLAVGCAAILGHIFPIYVRFRGGKGVTTSFGVALGLWPYFTACALAAIALWAVVVLIWRYVSLASMVASMAFPVFLVLAINLIPGRDLAELWPLLVAAGAIPLAVIARHRGNIKRLVAGTESKVLQRRQDGNNTDK
jgi:glycerol-3-phosphate acyltransferase PlsY